MFAYVLPAWYQPGVEMGHTFHGRELGDLLCMSVLSQSAE